MNSIVAYTEEIDDLQEAVDEILEQTAGFTLCKNSLALVFMEEETDYDELYSRLSSKWDFPIIGCTAMSMLTGQQGYCPVGISVMIMSADDVSFSVSHTGDLEPTNYRELIDNAYRQAAASHTDDIKLILCFAGMVITEKHVAGDDLLDALNTSSNNVPVYGATASDGFTFSGFHAYCNGDTVTNGMVLALISGNIRPRFTCINSVENRAGFSYRITGSESNKIYRLGNDTFIDTLAHEDMMVDKTDVLGDYILSPFIVSVQKGEDDHVEVARNLTLLDHNDGSGSFLGVMPEGSMLSIGVIIQDDVKKSVSQAFDNILTDLNSPGSSYHTLLCNSCCARFLALASNTSAEGETYLGRLPEDVSLMGIYAYGEYCPIRGDRTGIEYNMFHNFTFTILAL